MSKDLMLPSLVTLTGGGSLPRGRSGAGKTTDAVLGSNYMKVSLNHTPALAYASKKREGWAILQHIPLTRAPWLGT